MHVGKAAIIAETVLAAKVARGSAYGAGQAGAAWKP